MKTLEEKTKIFQDYLKGRRCIICAFNIDSVEEIIETPDGYVHRECLADNTIEHTGENNEKLKI